MLPSSSLLSRLFQSTHPTRGCDCSQIAFNASCFKFQSTHPTRGCDQPGRWTWTTYKHFNPRTPRGGATWILGRPGLQISISIHAPHEGVRPIGISSGVISLYFNPRTPRGGATAICCSLISRVTTCCRPNITPLLDVVRFLNYCTNLLLFLGEPPRLFRTASGSPMSLHY